MLRGLARLFNPARFSPASNDALRRMVESIPLEEGVDSKRCLFDLLDAAHKFSVPKWMIDREFKAIWRFIRADQAGEIEPAVAKTEVQLKNEYRAIAERRVRLGLVLKAIAHCNDIVLRDDEIADVRASGYRGDLEAILELKIVEFIFGLAGRKPD